MTDYLVIYPNDGTTGAPIPLDLMPLNTISQQEMQELTKLPQAKLHVAGKIICEEELKVAEINTDIINSNKIKAKEVKVDMNNVADYVFEENYNLKFFPRQKIM